MGLWKYVGWNGEGKLVLSGLLRYDSDAQVRADAADHGITLTEIKQITNASLYGTRFAKQKADLYREIAAYKRSKLGNDRMVDDLIEMFDPKDKFTPLVVPFLEDIRANHAIYDAMSRRPGLFDDQEVVMMRQAFEGGKEPETLGIMSKFLGRSSRVTSKVVASLWYPSVLMVALVAMVITYSFTMFPMLRTLYTQLGIEPVFPMNIVLQGVDLMSHPVFDVALVVVVGILVALGLTASRLRVILHYADVFLLNIPIFGEIIRHQRLVMILYSVWLMIAGNRRRDAFLAALSASQGSVHRQAVERCKTAVDEGKIEEWHEAFRLAPEIFPRRLLGTIRSGELNGDLVERILDYIHELEERIDDLILIIPERLQANLTVIAFFVLGFFLYIMWVPTSSAIAHLHG